MFPEFQSQFLKACVLYEMLMLFLDNLCCYRSYFYSFTVSKESYGNFPTSRIRSKVMFVTFILWSVNECFWEKQQELLNLWKAAISLLGQMSCLLCSTTFLLALKNKYGTKWRIGGLWLIILPSLFPRPQCCGWRKWGDRMTPAGSPRWGEKSLVLRDPRPREWRLH